jgi:YidC/Oxa1 family membrane protein insertase
MEKRAILAAVLMAAVLIVYQMFFLPTAPESPPAAQKSGQPSEKPAPPAPERSTSQPAVPTAPAPVGPIPNVAEVPSAPRPPQHTASVDTPLYHATVSSEGGKLQDWVLRYRGDKPMVIVGELGPTGLTVAPPGAKTGQAVAMMISPPALVLGNDRRSDDIVMTGEAEGLKISEILRFGSESFTIDAFVRLENVSGTPKTVTVTMPWMTRERWGSRPEKFAGQHPTEIVWASQGSIARLDQLTAVPDRDVDGAWIGFDSVWYLTAMIPKTPGFTLAMMSEGKAGDDKSAKDPAGVVRIAVRASPALASGQTWEGHVVMYAGPKEYERLAALGLDGTINFGGFPLPRKYGGLPMEWLGIPILRLLKWIYSYVHNYGIAIIVVTIVSRALLYPLTVKSFRSMKAMQALAPQINALRSKYKSDPQRLQRETMELYRKHNVNPVGGCLPMVAQVPIFYALYLALSVSVELQNAGFICFGRMFGVDLWICDLASHDPTYVLPIFMGISMFVQQKMTPTAADPRQAKMMLVMPFVFTFMFLNLPSGLVLYWFVSNVLQVLQQKSMDRPTKRDAAHEARDTARA